MKRSVLRRELGGLLRSQSRRWLRGQRLEARLQPTGPEALLRSAEGDDWEVEAEAEEAGRPVSEGTPPETTSIVLFPGQGSQFVGMGRESLAAGASRQLWERASEVAGRDLLGLCLEGPEEELGRTSVCQLAVFAASLAGVEALREMDERAVRRCVDAAGLSVGELAALVFAGSLRVEEGLRLVKERGRLMEVAAEAAPSGLLSVSVRAASQLSDATAAAREWARRRGIERPVCHTSTHLFTQFKVLGGHEECLDFLEEHGEAEFKLGPMKRLRVAGAFHTELMKEAAEEWRGHLARASFAPPRIPVWSNFSAKPFPRDAHSIRKLLYKNVFRSVRWEQTMKKLLDREQGVAFPRIFEVGPGSQLTTIVARCNRRAVRSATSVPC